MKNQDGSKIFTGFRALGYVCDHLPLCLRRHQVRKENYVVTSIGRAFHVYNVSKLGLVSVSDLHDDDITAIACDDLYVYTASRKIIRTVKQNRHVFKTLKGHDADVHLLLPFGPHLASVDEDSKLILWDVQAETPYLELQFNNESFNVSAIAHPSTYINKILLGSHQGSLQLWNVKSNKMVYTFKGWKSGVTLISQAPAVDVVAIGLADGRIIVHNLRIDSTLMTFAHEGGPVTSVTFRTDGFPVMISASASGSIAVWDLEAKRLLGQLDKAHSTSVSSVHCLQNEPLMLSNAADNSLKVWIFDLPDGMARTLRSRSFHSAPPTRIQFYGANGDHILSAGQDSTLRRLSTVHERFSKSLGRASYNKKMSKRLGAKKDTYVMPSIKDFSAVPTRESVWDSIVCIHSGLGVATSWNYEKSTMGAHRLLHERFADQGSFSRVVATNVAVTQCGNFVFLGYSTGHVDIFNLQSGLHRGSFGDPTAHVGSVRGVVIDALNQVVATAGADAKLKFWIVRSKKLSCVIDLPSPASLLRLQSHNSLLAVALDDFSVILFDFDTKKLVRKMTNASFIPGCSGKVMDLTFSPDGRWLVIVTLDSLLTTWDVASGLPVDCVRMESPVTSLSFSPAGDFIATTHADDLGVYLWSNATLYQHVNLRPLPSGYQPYPIVLPTTSRHASFSTGDVVIEEDEPPGLDDVYESPAQISDELVTLSLLPNSRWKHLLHLDVIKQRNRPKEPVKVPKNAPFFLPTVANVEGHVLFGEDDDRSDGTKGQKSFFFSNPLSAFAKQLLESFQSSNYDKMMLTLKDMGPSSIDMELGLLSPESGGSSELCLAFLDFASKALDTRRDFELVNAYLGVFLAKCGDTLAREPRLVDKLNEVKDKDGDAWNDLEHQLHQSLCVIKFLRSATL